MLPVRVCPLPGPLYTVLKGYKEAPVAEARRRFTPLVRTLLDGFLAGHGACIAAAAGGPPRLALAVPSSHRAVAAALDRVDGVARDVETRLAGVHWHQSALVRGPAPVGPMRPDRGAYGVPAASRRLVSGARVVLVDDVYVSGARAQSAAAALRRAGATSVLIVVLGRVLRPERVAAHARFLRELGQRAPRADVPGDPPRCSRCVRSQAGRSTE